jgi:hypothetical protein
MIKEWNTDVQQVAKMEYITNTSLFFIVKIQCPRIIN